MYNIQQYQPEIRLIGTNGEIYRYKNYQTFIESTNYWFVEKYVIDSMKDQYKYSSLDNLMYLYYDEDSTYSTKYIVRDKFGSMFSRNEILKDIYEYNKSKCSKDPYVRKYKEWYDHVIFRHTPVPGTGKNKWRFRNYYKKPKTAQEKRWSYAHKKYVRGKRRSHMLPSVWDDRVRGDIRNRKSWKNRKKYKQWM